MASLSRIFVLEKSHPHELSLLLDASEFSDVVSDCYPEKLMYC